MRGLLWREGRACAWLSSEAHCPQGAAGRSLRGSPVWFGLGLDLFLVLLGAAEAGLVADFELQLSSAGQSREKVDS